MPDSVCQPSSSSPIKIGPIFAPAVNMHFALEPPSESRGKQKKYPLEKSNAQRSPLAAFLHFHEVYLKTRLEKTAGYVSTKQLLREITDRGYRGKVRVLQRFLSTIRVKAPKEASLQFHKEYLSKRVERLGPDRVVAKRLFEEIQAKGYRGAYKTVRTFLATMRMKAPKEAFLKFHKDYLIKRIQESTPDRGLAKQLFQEITDRGYQGALSTMQGFLSMIHQKKKVRETSLEFHKEYLKKRIEETAPSYVSAKQLFQEITDKGYQGALSTMRGFLSVIRQKTKVRKTSLEFHRKYLKKRIEEPNYVSTRQLFQEITDRGYRGSPDTMRGFLSMIRQKKKIEKTSLGFHKEYLKKRIEEAAPSYLSAKQLFQEITDKGYRGSIRTVQLFVATIRANKDAKKQTSTPHRVAEHTCAEDPFCSPIDVSSDLNALFDDVVEKDFLHSPFFSPLL